MKQERKFRHGDKVKVTHHGIISAVNEINHHVIYEIKLLPSGGYVFAREDKLERIE